MLSALLNLSLAVIEQAVFSLIKSGVPITPTWICTRERCKFTLSIRR